MKLLVTKTFLCRNIFLLNQYYFLVIHILKDWITIDNWMNIYIYIYILEYCNVLHAIIVPLMGSLTILCFLYFLGNGWQTQWES